MIGNAWEWVARDSVSRSGETLHAIKGGAFDTPPKNAAAAYHGWVPDDRATLWKTGFRCVWAK